MAPSSTWRSMLIVGTIVLRGQLLGHLGALVALDSLQLVLDVPVDWVIGVVMRDAGLGVVFLVDGPSAGRLAVGHGLIFVVLITSIAVSSCAPIAALADGAGASYRTSKASWATWTKRGAALATEGVVKVVRSCT